jgi:hypothetical protein
MGRKEKEYRRLPGRGRNLSGTTTLWLGPDHLLRVDSHRYAEDYKRFYYNDIQSIVLLPSTRRHSILIASAAVCVPLALLALFLEGAWTVFLGCLAGVAGLMLAVNWLRGETCECRLQTAVQTEVLQSLNRLRTALKALRLLQPRVEAIQGKLGPDLFHPGPDAASPMPSLVEPGLTPGTASRAIHPDPRQAERLVPHSSGVAHAVLFSLLPLHAAATATDMAVNHLAVTLAGVLIYLALTPAVIVALIHQSRTDIGHFLRWQVLASLGYVCVSFLLNSAYSMAAGLSGKSTDNYWRVLVALSETSVWESPWLMGMSVFSIAVSLAIAIPGWVDLARFWVRPGPPGSSDSNS